MTLVSVLVYLRVPGCVYSLIFLCSLLVAIFPKQPADTFYLKLTSKLLVVLAVYCLVLKEIAYFCQFSCVAPSRYISLIRAKVIFDSSFTSYGNHLMKVRVLSAGTISGITSTARGVITVTGHEQAIITTGTEVVLRGSFNGEIFNYDSLVVVDKSLINSLRERIIGFIEYRIGSKNNEAALLGIQLLLGRSDGSGSEIRDLAENSGCLHVLALSGMHLNVLTRIFRFSKLLCHIVVALFVFIAGPRPSLVRATIFYYLSFLPVERRFVWSLIIQTSLFPFSVAELGFCYSYLAVFALTTISSVFANAASYFLGAKLGNIGGTQLGIFFLSAPLSLIVNGSWTPVAMLASFPAGLLISLEMVVSLLILMFGRLKPLVAVQDYIFFLIKELLTVCSTAQKGGWISFTVFVALSLSLLGVIISICVSKDRKKFPENRTIQFLCSDTRLEEADSNGILDILGAEACSPEIVGEGFSPLGKGGPDEAEEIYSPL